MAINFAAVDDILAEFHDGQHAPGVQVGVFGAGQLIHFSSCGAIDTVTSGSPGKDRVFRIASMSKSFTAAAILQLRDHGLLHLDDPIRLHLPGATGLAGPTTDSPPVTVRHCLTMSSGLPSDDPWADREEAMPQAAFDALLARPVAGAYAPGSAFAYSNLGYAILGRVVEAIVGYSFIHYVARELLAPLGLGDTTYDYRTVAPGRLAPGYRLARDCGWELQEFTVPGSFSAIGGLLSTVGDVLTWAAWLADAFPPRNGSDDTVLSRASRREMQQAHRQLPFGMVAATAGSVRAMNQGLPWGPSGYGYGLFVEDTPQWGAVSQHLGGYPGFGSYMGWHQSSGIGVVAFANGTYAPVAAPGRAMLEAVLQQDSIGPAEIQPSGPMTSALQLVEHVIEDPSVLQGPRFATNVLLDTPLDERVAAIATARRLVGEFAGAPEVEMRSPSEATYRQPAAHGHLEVSVAMTPTTPPQIHTFAVKVVR